jgi:hypothetical protein
MDTIIVGLAAATTIVIAPLAYLSAGIRRQDRASSLTAQPPGAAAALARKMLALHTTPLTGSQLSNIPAPPVPGRRPPARHVRLAAQVRP